MSHPDAECTQHYLAGLWERPHPWDTRLIVTVPPPSASHEERRHAIEYVTNHSTAAAKACDTLAIFTDGVASYFPTVAYSL
ncbi:hypothetical protein FRC06_010861, partial [Ceratobasidium sp. 370]